nr:MAG TPA: hypothetical protein [Caudoviricetes sp.]
MAYTWKHDKTASEYHSNGVRMPFLCITPRAFSWYASFYFCIRFVSKFSNASFCGLY